MPARASQSRRGGSSPLNEAATWRAVGAAWRQLFGDFRKLGVSFEWHDVTVTGDFDWAASFHPESLELCLNLDGEAEVTAGAESVRFTPWTAGFYRHATPPLKAVRFGGQSHRFITVELSRSFLSRHLEGPPTDLHQVVRNALDGTPATSGVSTPVPLTVRQRELVASLRQPPVLASAQPLWYQAKSVELMGEFFFHDGTAGELFCHRQQRVARDRVDAVQAILRRDLVQPPPLDAMAREVACSPFYLSRTFSKETGLTIPQYLRQLRMEKAAELLRTGRYNVTEVALEVGYNSLSHFSQAFHQTYGCCPGLYPLPGAAMAAKG
jgi:AraC family transcriptional regulator